MTPSAGTKTVTSAPIARMIIAGPGRLLNAMLSAIRITTTFTRQPVALIRRIAMMTALFVIRGMVTDIVVKPRDQTVVRTKLITIVTEPTK